MNPSANLWQDPDGTVHERCRLVFHIQSDFFGETPFDPGAAPQLGYRRTSLAYFCPDCGEVWARVVLLDSSERTAPFDVEVESCERHPAPGKVPGSILEGYRNDALLQYLTPAALKREALLHLKMKEKQ